MKRYRELHDRLGISEEDLTRFKDDHVGFCGVDTSRVSRLLLAQLLFIDNYRVLNSFSVTDVIQRLEGVGRTAITVRDAPFKHPPLKGLWKAHFFDASFMMKNLINEWGVEFEESKKFGVLCARVAADEERNPSRCGWQGRLADEFTIAGFDARARRRKMTGEWVIFGKHKEKNHYLCIANHSKSNKDDKQLHTVVKYFCECEFPFLFKRGT